jgi:dihydroxyacetone kinase
MTWLNMQGSSLTVLNLTSASSEQVACLDASTLPVFRLTFSLFGAAN